MPYGDWLVVGIGGATCSGKSTVASTIHDLFPSSMLIKQDDYFYDEFDSHQVKVESVNHVNFEIMSSLNMKEMWNKINEVLSKPSATSASSCPELLNKLMEELKLDKALAITLRELAAEFNYSFNLLIVEGFLIFNDAALRDICDLRIFITLDKTTMWSRRSVRVYNPPDPPGYFEVCIFPYYEKHFDEVKQRNENDLCYINGCNEINHNIFLSVMAVFKMILLKKIEFHL